MTFGRLLTAMVTPFRSDGSIDWSGVDRVVKHLVATGSDSLVVVGTTGESPTLTSTEKADLIAAVKGLVPAGCKVIAGTGTNNTVETLKNCEIAEKSGADGLMVVAPYYNKPPQESLYEHYSTIARKVNLPVIIYNVPGRTGCNIMPQTLARLSRLDAFYGVKEASGDLNQVSEIITSTPDDFVIYSGDDSLTLPILAVGGHGVISVASHIAGKSMKAMINAFHQGDVTGAASIHGRLMPLFKTLFVSSNPIPLKWAMCQLGIIENNLRPPLYSLGEREQAMLGDVLKAL